MPLIIIKVTHYKYFLNILSLINHKNQIKSINILNYDYECFVNIVIKALLIISLFNVLIILISFQ